MRRLKPRKWFVVCVRNHGYRASLELRKSIRRSRIPRARHTDCSA
jgi:hypothetical protein